MTTPAPATTAAPSVAMVSAVSAVSVVSTVSTVSSSTTAYQSNIDIKAYYRLINLYLGAPQSLDVVSDTRRSRKLKMADSGNLFGQFWHFALVGNDNNNPKYALRTKVFGEGFALDVDVEINDRSLHLAATGHFSGQVWTVTPWRDGTESLRLHE